MIRRGICDRRAFHAASSHPLQARVFHQSLDGAAGHGGAIPIQLQPCPAEWLEAYRVSTRVNGVGFDGPECAERVAETQPQFAW